MARVVDNPPARARDGRQKLIDAALRLGAQKSSLDSLGLRELAREADLNPNTFYRHFADLGELGLCIVEHFGAELRRDRNAARDETSDFATFLRTSCERYFEYAARHPNAFLLGFRELASPTKVGRAVRRLMDELAHELFLITRHFNLHDALDDAALEEVAGFLISQLFMLSPEYIEHPKARVTIVEKALRFAMYLQLGVSAAAQITPHAAPKRKPQKTRPVRARTRQA